MNNTPESLPLFGDDPAESSDSLQPESTPNEPDNAPTSADTGLAEEPSEPAPGDSQEGASQLAVEPDSGAPEVVSTQVAASAPAHSVGSADEMDAWLAGSSDSGTTGWMTTDAEADAAMSAWLAADPNAVPEESGPVVISAGRVDRMRPPRRPLVPRWTLWAALAVLVVGGIAAAAAGYLTTRSQVLVPTVAGLQTQAARDRLATVGLTLTVSDRRFSTLPIDTILTQTPEAGAQTRRGSAVTVVVSAGTEEFTMPDVVGEGLTLARSQLEQKGLQVQINAEPSDQPSDTVLATNPAAGASVHTGDIVKLTVAQGAGGTSTGTTSTLVPFTMTGVKVTLDPAAPVAGQPDTSLEVTRRLQSLLEASGATVVSTRSIADTGTTGSVTARQARARETSATASVGFDVISTGVVAGTAITYPSSSVAPSISTPSQMLSSQISSAMAGQAIAVRQTAGGTDVVLSVTNSPYVRVTLGSTASPEDLANFRDPTWADKIARSVYQGLASIYGVRNPAQP
jgi:N-acetylmuramoyl-L-alanine amidase